MPPKRIALDEWIELQRAEDPRFDRHVEEFLRTRGPKRKVPLLLDENLEAELIAELRSIDFLKVTVSQPGIPDDAVWAEARRSKLVIVTGDEDFWDDHRFPLARSPGVIIVAGRNAEQKSDSLATVFGMWSIQENWRRAPYFLDGCKVKASSSGVSGRLYYEGQVILID
jgi:predicted nuclease of predicted toxin-antitoxin system